MEAAALVLPWYATIEDVKSALDFKETSWSHPRIGRALESASRSVEALTHRRFYPLTTTRYFDWPTRSNGTSYRLWLDQDELISVSELKSGTTTISGSEYNLEPSSGPPFSRLELKLSGSASFGESDSYQRDISITGTFGYDSSTQPAGTLAEALDASETQVDVSDSSAVGIGDLIGIDSERMVVTDRSMLDTGATLSGSLGALPSANSFVFSGGTLSKGEVILVGAERMLVVDLVGSSAIVRRAWDGSTLAAHSGSDAIYALRSLTVERGATGTTASTHSNGASVVRWVFPGQVRLLTIAEAVSTITQETMGFVRRSGTGDGTTEFSGGSLAAMRESVWVSIGRTGRLKSI